MVHSFFKIFTTLGDQNILLLGLNGAGKSTILQNFQVGEVTTTEPIPGFIVEKVEYDDTSFTSWDLCNQVASRSLWRNYYTNISGLVFVVDSTDVGRFDEARDELMKLLDEEDLRDVKVLILANKMDVPNAVNAEELSKSLSLHNVRNRFLQVQSASGMTGDGLIQGLDRLADAIRS